MKPFMVTNEQAKTDICENTNLCKVCEENGKCKYQYASDLLDARELIDKHEALIKEMRGYIANMIEHNSDTIYITEGANILEKTKEYA